MSNPVTSRRLKLRNSILRNAPQLQRNLNFTIAFLLGALAMYSALRLGWSK